MNDNWRILAALVLTMIVLVGWNFLFAPQQQMQQPAGNQTRPVEQAEQQTAQRGQAESPTEASGTQAVQEPGSKKMASQQFSSQQGKSLSVDTPLYRAELYTDGGILEHFVLKKFKESIKKGAEPIDLISRKSMSKAPLGILWNQSPTWKQANWTYQGDDLRLRGKETGSITLKGDFSGLIVERVFTFQADSYEIKEQVRIRNSSGKLVSGSLAFTLASESLVADASRFNTTNLSYYLQGSLEQEDDTDDLKLGLKSEQPVSWAGIESNYFLMAAVPTSSPMYLKGKYEQGVYRVALEEGLSVKPEQSEEYTLSYYLGPKLGTYLSGAPNNLEEALNYGWLDIIANPLVVMLNFFYDYVGNYGLAIILLTFVIKIIFWPLSHKSYKSMEKMKKIQPMMKKLKEKHKDDRQKMNQELMQLYKTYKVNPAGGCLPMILQIPVFIALYEALLGALELRHATFITHVPFTDIVWLADLSAKDPLYVTPVVMGLSMFLQQKMSPTAGDPTQAKIMLFMPIFLTFIFLNFPAGLVVYFITNNLLSMAQQWWILRKA